jgi:hypothetical protein
MIGRARHRAALAGLLRRFPVVALLGPRQVGKTTLAREIGTRGAGNGRSRRRSATRSAYFDLENPDHASRLADPMRALEPLRGLVILDEIQLRPDLIPVLRVLADRPGRLARFLVLGSATPRLIRQSSESLAGRLGRHELTGLALDEVGRGLERRLWLRGGFPRSFLAGGETASLEWRKALVETYLDRDLPALGFSIPPATLRRFWKMLAHVHGQAWNATEFARSFGMSDFAVRRYLDILSGLFLLRLLQPWHENIGKRQVKAPRVYFADSGMLHAILGIRDLAELEIHPRLGASWEGFAVGQVMELPALHGSEWFFWRTHTGAELDLMAVRGRHRIGFEFKHGKSPGLTPSMRNALEDLKLDRLVVVHAGRETYRLGSRTVACPLESAGKNL